MKIPLNMISFLIFLAAPITWGNEFQKMGSCGSAVVTSGDTCSNVKVQFNFDGCQMESGPRVADRIICQDRTIKARFQKGSLRYEAQFEKTDDGWGGVSWKSLGSVTQFSKMEPKAKQNSAKVAAPRLPALNENPQDHHPVRVLASPQEPSASPSAFKFSGFADLRYTNFTTKNNPSTLNGNPESGFGIEDGAFYGGYEKEKLSVVLDVAFRRSKDVDANSAANHPNQSSNGNFAIGVDKSQLYLKYKITEIVTVNFGQFDTIFGVELNDSKDRIFGKTGIVYDYTMPTTHTGLMVEAAMEGFYSKILAANPNNKGSLGSSTNRDDKTEYGAAIGYGDDMFRGQIGYMTRPISHAAGTDSGNRNLVDAIIGTTLGRFSLDVEYSRISDPSKNTLTPAEIDDFESAGNGIFALASYKFNEEVLAGIRYEVVNDDPASLSLKKVTAFGGSLQYKFRPDLQLRTEYTAANLENVSNASWNDSRFNIAALLLF